jgi:transcriptional regulator with XRE-family HTH domain
MIDREMINLLKINRRKKRISIVELAKEINVSQQYLSRIEMGMIMPSSVQLEMIKVVINKQ